jgi:hypothetical protein
MELVGAQHVSIYSTEADLWFQRTGSSGMASGEGGTHFGDKYTVVSDLGGLTEMEFVGNLKAQNFDEGGYVFFANDCHTSAEKAIENSGGEYPGSTYGRVDLNERITGAIMGWFENLWKEAFTGTPTE